MISPSAEIKLLAQQFSAEDIQLFYQIGLKGSEEIHLAPTLTIGFNMTILRMLTFRPASCVAMPPLAFQQNEPIRPMVNDEDQPAPMAEEVEVITETLVDNYPNETATSETTISNFIEQEHITAHDSSDWNNIIPQLKLTGLALNAIENAEFVSKEDVILL